MEDRRIRRDVGGGEILEIQHKIHKDLILVTVLTTTLLHIPARGEPAVKCRLKQKSIFKEVQLLFLFGVDLPFVLRRIVGPRRDEVTGEWRRLHNEELNDLYSSPNIVWVITSRRMRWAGHVARMGEERGVYRVLLGKPEGKRPLGRPRRRWVDNIRTDLQEVRCGYVDWIGLAQDRDSWRTLVSTVMNLRDR